MDRFQAKFKESNDLIIEKYEFNDETIKDKLATRIELGSSLVNVNDNNNTTKSNHKQLISNTTTNNIITHSFDIIDQGSIQNEVVILKESNTEKALIKSDLTNQPKLNNWMGDFGLLPARSQFTKLY